MPLFLGIVSENRVGVLGLHTKNARQNVDDTQAQKLEKAAHDGSDISRVADRHEDGLAAHIPIIPLGHLESVAFLPQDTPGVFGIEQGHPVMVCQILHDLHAVIEHSGNLKHLRTASQGLGKLLGSDLSFGQQHHGSQRGADIGCIKGGCGRGVSGGRADGQDIVPSMSGHKMTQIGKGAGHATVLEGCRGVLTVVLEGHGLADKTLQGR